MALSTFTRDPLFGTFFDDAIDRAFNRFATGGGDLGLMGPGGSASMAVAPWRSVGGTGHPTDVIETDKSYLVKTDAPGFKPDEVDVQLSDDGSVLTISGRKEEAKTTGEEGKYWRSERRFMSFSRSFTLPENAAREHEAIGASLDNGILTINIPKQPEKPKPEPKRIAVKGGAPETK